MYPSEDIIVVFRFGLRSLLSSRDLAQKLVSKTTDYSSNYQILSTDQFIHPGRLLSKDPSDPSWLPRESP